MIHPDGTMDVEINGKAARRPYTKLVTRGCVEYIPEHSESERVLERSDGTVVILGVPEEQEHKGDHA